MDSRSRPPLRDDVRAVAWWVLVGVAAGAIAGLLVGGVGGRLAMLVLRLTSPDSVVGVTSDDGFEIGSVTTDTFQLLAATAFLGGLNGVLYVTARGGIPRGLRLPLWSLAAAVLGGAGVIHDDGVDFTLIEPAALAIVLFVLLPGAAAALTVLLVERWAGLDPAEHRRLRASLVVAALGSTFALAPAAGIAVVAVGLRRAGVSGLVASVGRVAVPIGLAGVTVLAGLDLARDISVIL